MVSHVKFLKKKNGTGKKIFFVKDTAEIICLDMEESAAGEIKTKATVVGKAKDAIIAMSVTDGSLRESFNQNADLE